MVDVERGGDKVAVHPPPSPSLHERCAGAWDAAAEAANKWLARPDQGKNKTLLDQWALHQSSWRWASFGLLGLFGAPMHVLHNIFAPLLVVITVALASAIAEYHRPDFMDPSDAFRVVFTMVSFSLSLLLAWKVNRVYERWWTARCSFAGVGNGVTALMRFASTYITDDALLDQLEVWCLSWHYAVLQLVTGKTQVTDPRVARLMQADELAVYGGTNKPRLLGGAAVSVLFSEAGLPPQLLQVAEELVWYTTREYGVPVRVKLQALPVGLSGFTTTLLYSMLIMFPWGLSTNFRDPHARLESLAWQVAAVTFAAAMLLGLDEICTLLEDPFPYMPLEAIVATTARDVPRIRKEVAALRALARRRRAEITAGRRRAELKGGGGGGGAADVPAM